MPTPQNPGPWARALEDERHPEEVRLSERLKAQKAASNMSRAEAGNKSDAGKPRWDLMSFPLLDQVAQVLAAGAAEYGAENWRKVPDARARYRAALFRHLCSFMCGERSDPKSGLPHLAHAACNLMFLFELEETWKVG